MEATPDDNEDTMHTSPWVILSLIVACTVLTAVFAVGALKLLLPEVGALLVVEVFVIIVGLAFLFSVFTPQQTPARPIVSSAATLIASASAAYFGIGISLRTYAIILGIIIATPLVYKASKYVVSFTALKLGFIDERDIQDEEDGEGDEDAENGEEGSED